MGTDMRLNFFIDTNPSAQIKIITDARADDAITAYGVGPIRASWHNKGGFEMYGTYKVVRGDYKLSLQDVIRKDLTLQEGSTITFGGNPLDANLALKALYTVNGVPLSDLNYGAGFTQKTVRADCILNIGGKARAPQVDFDLDLHNISSDESNGTSAYLHRRRHEPTGDMLARYGTFSHHHSFFGFNSRTGQWRIRHSDAFFPIIHTDRSAQLGHCLGLRRTVAMDLRYELHTWLYGMGRDGSRRIATRTLIQ